MKKSRNAQALVTHITRHAHHFPFSFTHKVTKTRYPLSSIYSRISANTSGRMDVTTVTFAPEKVEKVWQVCHSGLVMSFAQNTTNV